MKSMEEAQAMESTHLAKLTMLLVQEHETTTDAAIKDVLKAIEEPFKQLLQSQRTVDALENALKQRQKEDAKKAAEREKRKGLNLVGTAHQGGSSGSGHTGKSSKKTN